ncbi:MAG: VOC family protein [Bacteroidetes bacterium]|nr:VOC family protein [Bacteroidota bacterium]
MSLTDQKTTFFAPHLALKNVQAGMDFYVKAFGAIVLRSFDNSDGSVHVAEMEIEGAMFHLHEESPHNQQLSPETVGATTNLVGIFTSDPDKHFNRAVVAGGSVSSVMQDYEYGYRQGVVTDPFGHQWLIQKKI